MKKLKDTSWNDVSEWYHDALSDPESYQQCLILPNLLRLLGSVRGKRVLDLACGEGFFSRACVQAGAVVVGVDNAPDLIALAQKQRTAGAEFLVADASALPPSCTKSLFDVAVCVLALQNMRNLDAVMAEVARVLKVGGRFLLVLNHPCFRIPKKSSWEVDESVRVQYRRLDGYLSESQTEIVMHPGKEKSAKTISFHRPLQVYFKSFAKHSFSVARLEEWISHKESGKGPRKAIEDRARKEFPLFLFLELLKSTR